MIAVVHEIEGHRYSRKSEGEQADRPPRGCDDNQHPIGHKCPQQYGHSLGVQTQVSAIQQSSTRHFCSNELTEPFSARILTKAGLHRNHRRSDAPRPPSTADTSQRSSRGGVPHVTLAILTSSPWHQPFRRLDELRLLASSRSSVRADDRPLHAARDCERPRPALRGGSCSARTSGTGSPTLVTRRV